MPTYILVCVQTLKRVSMYVRACAYASVCRTNLVKALRQNNAKAAAIASGDPDRSAFLNFMRLGHAQVTRPLPCRPGGIMQERGKEKGQ